jgi:hypothetical protein
MVRHHLAKLFCSSLLFVCKLFLLFNIHAPMNPAPYDAIAAFCVIMLPIMVPILLGFLYGFFWPEQKKPLQPQTAPPKPFPQHPSHPKPPRFATKASRICLLLSPLGIVVTALSAAISDIPQYRKLRWLMLQEYDDSAFLLIAWFGILWTVACVVSALWYEQTLGRLLSWVRAGK